MQLLPSHPSLHPPIPSRLPCPPITPKQCPCLLPPPLPPCSDDVFLVAAERLASMSSLAELEAGFLFPRFSGIKRVSARLMAACADYMVSE